jgi:nucleoside-diphosphate-sugar epimerase
LYLVTGGAGFIGSHVVEALVARGDRVRVLDNFSTGSRENLAACADRIEIIQGDIRDRPTVSWAMDGVTHVLHQAAVASVHESIRDPLGVDDTNVRGTLNVLWAAQQAGVRRLVFASSAAVYGDAESLPLGEDLPFRPLSPYAATKVAGEAYVRSFAASYDLPGVLLRYFNVYGPRQDPASPYSGVITKFVAALAQGEAPTIFGDGQQTRDFVYVQDVAQANLLACSVPEAAGLALNVASGQQTSILQLARLLGRIAGQDRPPEFAPARAGEIRHSLAGVRRAQQILEWHAPTNLQTGLRQTFQSLSPPA